jgi:hypothetical protein
MAWHHPAGDTLNRHTIQNWVAGSRIPRTLSSLQMLGRIEHRYRLPEGYFRAMLPHQTRAPGGLKLKGVASSEQRRLAWHLPDDFNQRP